MDDLLLKVLSRLVTIHDELGEESYQDAAHRALLAIALAAKVEAERSASIHQANVGEGVVVPFPLSRTQRQRKDEGPSSAP